VKSTPPAPEVLVDHAGRPRTAVDMPLSYEQTRLGIAFHEAGHAVLALAYGMRVITSEVIAWEPEPGRFTVTGRTRNEAAGTPPWRYAAQLAAGEIAHVTYLMTYGLWTPERAAACQADHDRDNAITTLARFGYALGHPQVSEDGKSWGMVRGMARRKVTHLWNEIRTVALAMDEHTVLTGDDVAALTGMVNPSFGGGAA